MSIRKIRRNEFIKVASIPLFNTFLPYNSISKYLNKNDHLLPNFNLTKHFLLCLFLEVSILKDS